jgi:hypothetical protein
MRRRILGRVRNPRVNLAVWFSGLAALSIAAVTFSIFFRDASTAIAGVFGFSLLALGLVAWRAARSVRRAVADLRTAGKVAWPVSAQSDRDRRNRLGILEADQHGVVVTLRADAIRLEWSDITSVALQARGLFRAGHVLLIVPTRGTMILDILAPNALVSLSDPELEDCRETLNDFKVGIEFRDSETQTGESRTR